jgi:hypothetical protein
MFLNFIKGKRRRRERGIVMKIGILFLFFKDMLPSHSQLILL